MLYLVLVQPVVMAKNVTANGHMATRSLPVDVIILDNVGSTKACCSFYNECLILIVLIDLSAALLQLASGFPHFGDGKVGAKQKSIWMVSGDRESNLQVGAATETNRNASEGSSQTNRLKVTSTRLCNIVGPPNLSF